jgi:hypothetical protein
VVASFRARLQSSWFVVGHLDALDHPMAATGSLPFLTGAVVFEICRPDEHAARAGAASTNSAPYSRHPARFRPGSV